MRRLSEAIVAQIQAGQRPNGGEQWWGTAISKKVGSGSSLHLRVFADGISESSHPRSIIGPHVVVLMDAAKRVVADIQRRQRPLGLWNNSYFWCAVVSLFTRSF